jgi:hypothetical protein
LSALALNAANREQQRDMDPERKKKLATRSLLCTVDTQCGDAKAERRAFAPLCGSDGVFAALYYKQLAHIPAPLQGRPGAPAQHIKQQAENRTPLGVASPRPRPRSRLCLKPKPRRISSFLCSLWCSGFFCATWYCQVVSAERGVPGRTASGNWGAELKKQK